MTRTEFMAIPDPVERAKIGSDRSVVIVDG
jgi:hypothetical protein